MGKNKNGLISKASAEASAGYDAPTAATADTASGNDAPTIGKSIPIIAGGARPRGEVIWAYTYRDKLNACRGHIAVCFGRNPFGRALSLSAMAQNGTDIYIRKDGVSLDTANPVRFYDGTQTAADPLIASIEGANNTPAWKGYIYAVIEDIVLEEGDTEFHSEFTDNGSESSISGAACDASLAGIDLKYNPYTGLFYGLKDAGTDHASIIISDGCTKLREAEIRPDGNRSLGTFRIDALDIIECCSLVTVNGFFDVAPGEPDGTYGPRQWIVNPDTAQIVGGDQWLTAPAASSYNTASSMPSSTGVEIKAAFSVPNGGSSQFATLRLMTRGDTVWEDITAGGYVLPLGPYSNMSGLVFDMNDRTNYDPTWYGFDGSGRVWGAAGASIDSVACFDVALVSRAVPEPWFSPLYYYTSVGWWVDQAPFLDDFIFLKNTFVESVLGGYAISGGTLTFYLLNYNADGISELASNTISVSGGWGGVGGWTVGGINYDPEGDYFLISATPPSGLLNSRIYKILVGPSATVSYIETGGSQFKLLPKNNGVAAGGWAPISNATGSVLAKIDLTTGDQTTIYSGTAPTGDPVVDLSRNLISLPTVTSRTIYAANQVAAGDIALSDLITDICALKGYSSGDLVFEGFTGLVARGMTISATTRVSDLLNRMGQLYGFVFAETDGKLKFRRRRASSGTAAPDVTLTDDDLIEGPENITVQRQAATTVLGSLTLTWLDPARDYESNSVVAKRIVGVLSGQAGTRDEEISLPLAIDQATARNLLFQSFYAQAEGETRVSFSVGPENLRIEPGDLVSITAGGSTRLVQARRVTHRADLNTLDIEADSFMAQANTIIGSAGGNVATPPQGRVAGAYVHLDIPLLRAADYPGAGLVRQYHGLTTFDASAWGGADFYTSPNGNTFTKVFDYDLAPMTVGVAQNTLSDTPQDFALDSSASLTITVAAGNANDFASVTYLEQMNDATLCAYGLPGAWEIISFQTVTDNLDGTLTLTGLQRGLYGSNKVFYSADLGGKGYSHQVGEYVCILDKSLLRSTVWTYADVNRLDNYAVVTADVDLASAQRPIYEMTGASLRPPPVANVIAEHVASSANLVVTWDPTTPIPHNWQDNGAAGSAPETYTYTVTIETLSNGTFTFTTTAATYTWTAYGSTLGSSALAHEQITDVSVMVTSPTLGDCFTTFATEIREA